MCYKMEKNNDVRNIDGKSEKDKSRLRALGWCIVPTYSLTRQAGARWLNEIVSQNDFGHLVCHTRNNNLDPGRALLTKHRNYYVIISYEQTYLLSLFLN